MTMEKWNEKIDAYIEQEKAKIGSKKPVYRIYGCRHPGRYYSGRRSGLPFGDYYHHHRADPGEI